MPEADQKAFPFPTADKHETRQAPAEPSAPEPSEDAIDQGIEESFPASDPVSVTTDKVKHDGSKR